MKIRYQGPLTAPIAKGQHVAELVDHYRRYAAAGRAAGRGRGRRRAGFFGRIWLGLKQLFGMA